MKNSLKFFLVLMLLSVSFIQAQVKIGGTGAPDPSAALDLSGATNQGLLIPRMNNQQRTAIQNPAAGLLIFNTQPTKGFIEWYNGVRWENATMYNEPLPQDIITDVPSKPTNVVAVAGLLEVTVTFDASTPSGTEASDFPILNYTVTMSPGGTSITTADASTLTATFTGLNVETLYTFTVVANCVAGPSDASDPSNEVRPYGYPAAPTLSFQTDPYNVGITNISVLYVPGETTALLYFDELTTPLETGGRPITGYNVSSIPTPWFPTVTATGLTSPIEITGLGLPGLHQSRTYQFTITATNSEGLVSQPATTNVIGARAAIPGAPTNFQAVPNGQEVTFTWDKPTDGGTVHNYVIQRRGSWNGQTWTDRLSVVGENNTTITLPNETWDSSEHSYRVVARNAGHTQNNQTNRTHCANVITFKVIPGSTTDFHDSFNEAPITAKWEEDPTPFGFYQPNSTPSFFGNSTNISKMYGQADGRWLLERESASTSLSARTVHTIDRVAKNVEVQFALNPLMNGESNGFYHRFGFRSVSGISDGLDVSFFINNGTGMMLMETTGDFSVIGGVTIHGTPGVIPAAFTGDASKVSVRIIFFKTGGMEIWANGQVKKTWTAAEFPAAFNNLKFFVQAGRNEPVRQQQIDDFYILSYD